MKPRDASANSALFGSDLWQAALEKYAAATHLTVTLFDLDGRVVIGPIHPTPLFQLFAEAGYDPGIFGECTRCCIAQAEERPPVLLSQFHGLAVVGASLALEGRIVGAAVGGYALADFSQVSEIKRLAKQSGIVFERVWEIAREQPPVPQQRLVVYGELLQVLGDALLRENYRMRGQQSLVNELAHRGKNLLAIVQSIASRSLSGKQSLAEAREALMQRIQALARSQTMLLNGAFQGAPVAEIIRLECEAFSDRVKSTGPNVVLNPRATQTFALIMHELATNAAKYGALSKSSGTIVIDWSIENAEAGATFNFRWMERDGPQVAKPIHEGFGRTVIEKAAAQEFGVSPKIDYAPEGLSYEIKAPLSAVVAGAAGEGSF